MASLYSPQDDSLNAVLMIALINFKVKHIIVAVSTARMSGALGQTLHRVTKYPVRRWRACDSIVDMPSLVCMCALGPHTRSQQKRFHACSASRSAAFTSAWPLD